MSILFPTIKKSNDRTSNLGFGMEPTMSTLIDDFFNSNFGTERMSNFNRGMTLPAVNVIEKDREFIVKMAVPGMKKEDFDINLDQQLLSISVDETTEKEEEQEHYTRREFGYAAFKRSFRLPKTIETDKINALYEDGILSIHLPKREEAVPKPSRQIEIS